VLSIRWKMSNPLISSTATAPSDASMSALGAWPGPVNA
jgi:hypothetical protein